MANRIQPQNVEVHGWYGAACTAYTNATSAQDRAADAIGNTAGDIASSLLTVAVAGAVFYAALAAIILFELVPAVAAVILAGPEGALVRSMAGATSKGRQTMEEIADILRDHALVYEKTEADNARRAKNIGH